MFRRFYIVMTSGRRGKSLLSNKKIAGDLSFADFSSSRRLCVESSIFKNDDKFFPELEKFSSSFWSICNDVTHDLHNHLSPVSERIKKVLHYNALGGKEARGLLTVLSLKMLSNNKLPYDLKLAFILGWCVELVHTFFLVADDVMDHGLTRRGKVCWYRHSDVGLEAVNDALILERCAFKLLRMYFSDKAYYTKICDEFDKAIEITVWGQALDMLATSGNAKPNLEIFKLDHYWKVAEYKTAYYTFCFPVFLAMHIVGNFNEEHFVSVKNICMKLGCLFQSKDDYLDAYGKSNVIGKVGTDIQEGKCTWFSATAMECCSNAEKELMQKHYGVKDSSATNEILCLYESLHLKDKYLNFEHKLYNEICFLISQLDENVLNKELFLYMLKDTYKRQK